MDLMGLDRLYSDLPHWLTSAGLVALTVALALAAHWISLTIASRAASRSGSSVDNFLIQRLRSSSRWLLIAIALSGVQPLLPLSADGLRLWSRASGFLFPAIIGWLAIAMLGVARDLIKDRADISASDNLRARQRRTRVDIFHRISVFVVLLVTICFMLMSIPSVRSIGVTLAASAGLAAIAVGAAAQPALKNLIGGLQMAIAEPIKIDDVVVMEGEWGRVEEIRLTYVVVKLWDERRLIVPVTKFLEGSFENWTRQTSQITGSVYWYLDPSADIPRLRAQLHRIIESSPGWDRRVCTVQVTDTKPGSIEVRALMSAKDASIGFELRCAVREKLLDFVRMEMPEALVRHRTVIERASPTRRSVGAPRPGAS